MYELDILLYTYLILPHTIYVIPLPVVPARGETEAALGICWKTFIIYRTCMRRAPARPVRACFVRSCCSVVVQEHYLRATPVQCNAKRRLSSHFTLYSSRPALHTSHLHFTLHTSSHLKPLSSSHLISALLISSHLFSHVIKVSSSQLFSSHPSIDQPFSSPRCSSQLISAVLHARDLLLSERSLLRKKKRLGAETFAHRRLRHICIYTEKPLTNTLYYKACTKHFPQNTLYYKACTKHFPVLLCTTKLAPSTSQYYFVLQSLHKALPSTTLCYKACTKPFPVLLCTTKLAQSTSQYYFVLRSLHKARSSTTLYCNVQSLHKARSSTTLYYKPCTKYVPVLHCTTKLAQSNSQYYFVLQSLRKLLPELLCTTQLAQSTSQYYFVLLCTTFCYKHCTK